MDPLKMYFLLKMGIFHWCVSLPEGTYPYMYIIFISYLYIYTNSVYIYMYLFIYIQRFSVTSDLSLQRSSSTLPGAVEKPA